MKKVIVHTIIGKFEVKYESFNEDIENNIIVFYIGEEAVTSFIYSDIVFEWK